MKPRAFDFDADYGRQYDNIIRLVFPAYDELFPIGLAMLAAALSEDAHLLIVGTGTGKEIATFAGRRPGWRFTGVDPSEQMVEQAVRRVRAAGIEQRVSLHHGYVADLPPEPRFDAATLVCVMHFVPDDGSKLKLLRDIAARLRAAAPLLLVDACGRRGSEALERMMAAWMWYVRDRGLTMKDQRAYEKQVRDGVHSVPETRVRELLDQAGFEEPTRFFSAFVFDGWVTRRGPSRPD